MILNPDTPLHLIDGPVLSKQAALLEHDTLPPSPNPRRMTGELAAPVGAVAPAPAPAAPPPAPGGNLPAPAPGSPLPPEGAGG